MVELKEKHPHDDNICDPKTGIVYASRKRVDGGVDGGKGGE
jgi:hypothetical protein